MAERRNLANVGTNHLALATWTELAFGNGVMALENARRVLSRSPNYDPRLRAALTLSLTGYTEEAESIVNELEKAHPQHTIINSVLSPIVRAGIALARNEPSPAIDQLRIVEPFEFGFCAALAPIHLRAQAYLMEGLPVQAAVEFQRLLDHRGSEPFSPFYAAATLGLARARHEEGNVAASMRIYERFLRDWSNADSDIPMLVEARNEYGRMQSEAPAPLTDGEN